MSKLLRVSLDALADLDARMSEPTANPKPVAAPVAAQAPEREPEPAQPSVDIEAISKAHMAIADIVNSGLHEQAETIAAAMREMAAAMTKRPAYRHIVTRDEFGNISAVVSTPI